MNKEAKNRRKPKVKRRLEGNRIIREGNTDGP
jgi:hypothetical protein